MGASGDRVQERGGGRRGAPRIREHDAAIDHPQPALGDQFLEARHAAAQVERCFALREPARLNGGAPACAPPKTPEKRPCAPEDGIRKMASLTARNRLFHDIVPDFRDRPAMENRVRFSYA